MHRQNRSSFVYIFLLSVLLICTAPSRVVQAQQGPLRHHTVAQAGTALLADYVPSELIVRFRPGVNPAALATGDQVGAASLQNLLQRYQVTTIEQLLPTAGATTVGLERLYKLALAPEADLLAFLAALSAEQTVEFAEPNYIYYTQEEGTSPAPTVAMTTRASQSVVTPSDRLFAQQWALYNGRTAEGAPRIDLHAPEAWSKTTGANDLLIAVLDSGIDYTHEELNDGRVRTDIDKDYVNNDDDAMDDAGHGTHVAGTIAAASNNGIGVSGILWQAQLLPLKVCDESGACAVDTIVSAIQYAADQGARIINMSIGGSGCSSTLEAAVDYAYFEKGAVLVAAAGNENALVGYPAAYEPVIAVGALDRHGQRAYFSNYGDALDLVAPGVRVFSTAPNNGYDTFSGTSMAAPHVTGVAGLLLAQQPMLTNHQVRQLLFQSAVDLGEKGLDRQYGYGLINAEGSLSRPPDPAASVPGSSHCTEVPCGSAAALSGQPDETALLTNLRAVRDQLFVQQPGVAWRTIYYNHQAEVFWLLLADADLRTTALRTIRTLNPALVALLNEREAKTLVTTAMVEQANQVISDLADRGSPALRADLQREWQQLNPTRFVGLAVGAAWQQVQAEGQTTKIYLPLAAQ